MTLNELKEIVDNVPVMGTPTHTGSNSGLYILFSKWNEDPTWGFTQSYITKEGVQHMTSTVNDELLTKLDMKLMFADSEKGTLEQLFNTMEYKQNETAN